MTEPLSPFEKPTLDKDLEKLSFIETSTHFVMRQAAGPGLGMIFIVLAALFSALFVSSSPASLAIITGAVIAAYMAMNIGANDVTNNVGAAVGAKAITMVGALSIAFVFEIAGAYFAGSNVVQTIKSGIVNPYAMTSPSTVIAIMLSAMLSAALWINLATWINAPVSTTHSIVGGIMGAGAMAAGMDAVNWHILGWITISWIISPMLGAMIAIGFLWFIKETIIYTDDKIAAARKWVPVLLAVMAGSFVTYLMIIAQQSRYPQITIGHALSAGLIVAIACLFWFRGLIHRQSEGLENRNQSLKILFRVPLIFSAALLSFAHGANDVANAIGPLAAIVEATGIQTVARNLDAPFWVTTIGALGISVGLALFGPRLIRVVGSQITKLNPVRAFCVAIAAAITVNIASILGLPVSSTHVAVGSVFGVGLFREWYTANSHKRRAYILARSDGGDLMADEDGEDGKSAGAGPQQSYRYLVRRSYLSSILAAWLVTVPASGLLAALLVLVLQHIV